MTTFLYVAAGVSLIMVTACGVVFTGFFLWHLWLRGLWERKRAARADLFMPPAEYWPEWAEWCVTDSKWFLIFTSNKPERRFFPTEIIGESYDDWDSGMWNRPPSMGSFIRLREECMVGLDWRDSLRANPNKRKGGRS